MALAFILTMPNNNSWNRKWSGQGKCYAVIRNVGKSKASQAKAAKLAEEKSFRYDFGDGWTAAVEVRQVDNNEARQLRRQTLGFQGYDWMVSDIILHGNIGGGARAAKEGVQV